jgi:hypothetical protein
MENPMARVSFKDYAAQEATNLTSGEKLLAPEQVMDRLSITRRQLHSLHGGTHPRGLYLPACRLGQKTIRYRLQDVLRLEYQALHGPAAD